MTLHLTIISGKFLVNLDMFKKQDPYVCLNYNNEKHKTTIKHNHGKAATWNEVFKFGPILYDEKIVIEAWDYDTIGSHDFIGKSEELLLREYALIKEP